MRAFSKGTALCALAAVAATLAAIASPKIYEHRHDRCRFALFDFQIAHALGLSEQQAEQFEEEGSALERICALDEMHLAALRKALRPEIEDSTGLSAFYRRLFADESGNVDPAQLA